VAALPGFLLSLVAVASGLGLGYAIAWAGLPGRRSCPVAGGPVGPRSRVHAKAHRREVPMRKGHFFARALGPRLWKRFSAKAIRGQWRRPPDGPACARARTRARDWGNNGRLLIILADNYNHTTINPTTEAQSARRTNERRRLLL
jgi:hypothetical protein